MNMEDRIKEESELVMEDSLNVLKEFEYADLINDYFRDI